MSRLRYCLVAFGILFSSSAAFADGCYFPERAVKKIPEIPAQRAVVCWKDGVETLVISSVLDSESQKLGWIIPIPSVPKTIEKKTPGILKTLNFCIQPSITNDLYLELKGSVQVIIIANLILGTYLFKRKWFKKLIACILILLILRILMLPAAAGRFGVGTTVQSESVHIKMSAIVGSYDISVLSATAPEKLNAWLTKNGFSSLPDKADRTIAEYISKGWVFAATKLTRSETGTNAPHPIKLVFDSKKAVYPLQLTALAGGSTQFEIFVIGDDGVSCDFLEEEFCDKFSKVEHYPEEDFETNTSFEGSDTGQVIGHPAICSLMWDNCVLTKFSGEIPSDEMTSDLFFNWKPFVPFQQHLFTKRGARGLSLILFIWFAGGWTFVSMAALHKSILKPRGRILYYSKVLLPAFLIIAAAAGLLYVNLPKLNAFEVQTSRGLRSWYFYAPILRHDIEDILKDRQDILNKTEPEIAEYILEEINRDAAKNREPFETITGDKLRVEDSPGNFTVEKQQDTAVIRVYNHTGRALITELPISTH